MAGPTPASADRHLDDAVEAGHEIADMLVALDELAASIKSSNVEMGFLAVDLVRKAQDVDRAFRAVSDAIADITAVVRSQHEALRRTREAIPRREATPSRRSRQEMAA